MKYNAYRDLIHAENSYSINKKMLIGGEEDRRTEEKITEAAAARIRQLRLEKGCSQEEVSLTAGINPAYYGQVERGLKCPTIDTLYKISLALDVSLPELMRVDMGAVQSSEIERLKNLLALVPSEKREQVFAAFESIVKLLA